MERKRMDTYANRQKEAVAILTKISDKQSIERREERASGYMLLEQMRAEMLCERENVEKRTQLFRRVRQNSRQGHEQFIQSLPDVLPMLKTAIREDHVGQKPHSFTQKKLDVLQLMVLCLMRRESRRYQEAKDTIVLLYEVFHHVQEMDILKEMWLLLVGKIHSEMCKWGKKGESLVKKPLRGEELRRSQRNLMQQLGNTRKDRIVVRTMASRRLFDDQIRVNMRKMKLLYESTYHKERKKSQNSIYQGKSKYLIAKGQKEVVVGYPEPKRLFPTVPQVCNYDVAIIHRDPQTNFFPYRYPTIMSKIITRSQFVLSISRLNSVLVPERRCFDFDSALHSHFELLFLLHFVLFLAVLVMITVKQIIFITLVTVISAIAIGIISYRLHVKETLLKNKIRTFEILDNFAKNWEDQVNLRLNIKNKEQSIEQPPIRKLRQRRSRKLTQVIKQETSINTDFMRKKRSINRQAPRQAKFNYNYPDRIQQDQKIDQIIVSDEVQVSGLKKDKFNKKRKSVKWHQDVKQQQISATVIQEQMQIYSEKNQSLVNMQSLNWKPTSLQVNALAQEKKIETEEYKQSNENIQQRQNQQKQNTNKQQRQIEQRQNVKTQQRQKEKKQQIRQRPLMRISSLQQKAQSNRFKTEKIKEKGSFATQQEEIDDRQRSNDDLMQLKHSEERERRVRILVNQGVDTLTLAVARDDLDSDSSQQESEDESEEKDVVEKSNGWGNIAEGKSFHCISISQRVHNLQRHNKDYQSAQKYTLAANKIVASAKKIIDYQQPICPLDFNTDSEDEVVKMADEPPEPKKYRSLHFL